MHQITSRHELQDHGEGLMGDLRFISGEAALRNFIDGIEADASAELDDRNINASGKLKRSHRTEVTIGTASSTASFYALNYWTESGSGSPPGTKVEPSALAQWAIDKGLANNERRAARIGYLVSQKIAREGSFYHRTGGENVYSTAIDANADKIPEVLSTFVRDIPTALVREFKQAFN